MSAWLVALLRLLLYRSTWLTAVGVPVTNVYVVLPTVTWRRPVRGHRAGDRDGPCCRGSAGVDRCRATSGLGASRVDVARAGERYSVEVARALSVQVGALV